MSELHLNIWDEAIGTLQRVKMEDSFLRILIGHYEIVLVLDSTESKRFCKRLEEFIGCRVGVL